MAAVGISKGKVCDWKEFVSLPTKARGDRVEILHKSGTRIQALFDGIIQAPMENAAPGLRFKHRGVTINYFEGVNHIREAIRTICLIGQASDDEGSPICPDVIIDIDCLKRRSSFQESQ